MPAAFDKCRADGGKIRTKQLAGSKYMHICFLNGKSYSGEVKTKQAGASAPSKEAFVRAASK